MPTINKVILIGNLTRDPEMKYLPSGAGTCQVALALNRSYKDSQGAQRDDVTFVNIDFWDKTAELVAQYCRKGHALYVEGRLKVDSWQDRESGANRTMLKIVGETIQFLTPKSDYGSYHDEETSPSKEYRNEQPPLKGASRVEAPAYTASPRSTTSEPTRRRTPSVAEFQDDDIPF